MHTDIASRSPSVNRSGVTRLVSFTQPDAWNIQRTCQYRHVSEQASTHRRNVLYIPPQSSSTIGCPTSIRATGYRRLASTHAAYASSATYHNPIISIYSCHCQQRSFPARPPISTHLQRAPRHLDTVINLVSHRYLTPMA
jgi:hypothetical protein